MFIALIPFSSSLVNKFPEDSLADIFLASNMFLIGLLNYASWAYATKANRLTGENVSLSYINIEKKRLLIFPLVAILAIIVALVYPLYALYIFLLAPILRFFLRKK